MNSDMYNINLNDIFKNNKEFLECIDEVNAMILNIVKYKGNVCNDEKTLYEVLELNEEIGIKINSLYIYAHVRYDLDLSNTDAGIKYGKVMNIYNDYNNRVAFLVPEILENDESKILGYINSYDKLGKYERLLKEIYRTKKHMLSKEEEAIISSFGDAIRGAGEIGSKLNDVDLKFDSILNEKGKEVKVTHSSYQVLLENKNRKVREDAFKSMYKSYKEVNETFTETIKNHVKVRNNLAKIRKYDSAFSMELDGNNVKEEIYTNLIEFVNENLNKLHKQYKLRKKVMGVSKLHMYDMNAPLIKSYSKKYSYEDAMNLVIETTKILGTEYSDVIKKSFSNRWIDVTSGINKRSGAYCTCNYSTHPYVLLNFEENYENVSTLAHELGHAMHYYYAQKYNSYSDYNYSIFVAEVASQVNEILLLDYVMKNSNDEKEKISLLNQTLKDFRNIIGRQTMFAEFEKNIYDYDNSGEIITSEYLNTTYFDLVKKYFGKSVTVDKEIMYEWSRIPHFYYDFYVYQYATGYVAALKIANDIINNVPGSLDKYLEFLKLGCTKDPVESLKVAGVDMLDKKVYEDAFKVYEDALNKFEKCIVRKNK